MRLARLCLLTCLLTTGLNTGIASSHDAEASDGQTPSGFRVPQLNGIDIDGDTSDWGDRGFRIDLLHRVSRDGQYVQPRGDAPVRLAWDEQGLLVLVRVHNDTWVESAESAWRYDSVELYAAESRQSPQRYQVVLAAGMTETVPELVANLHDHRRRQSPELTLEAARKREGDTAVIEARLPWANLGIEPELGRRVAFQIMLNRNDEQGSGYGNTTHDVWYPAVGAVLTSWRMHTLRLAKEASPAYRSHVQHRYAGGRLKEVVVRAAPQLIGDAVRLMLDGRVIAASGVDALEGVPAGQSRLRVAGRKEKPMKIEHIRLDDEHIEHIGEVAAKPDRPFLITTRDQFDELIARAQREPWKTMKADAMERVAKGPPEEVGRGIRLNRYLGAAALLYILEPDHRQANAQRVREGIMQLADVSFDPKQAWNGTVPPMGAAFVAILALDIVHDDLSDEAAAACGAVIKRQIGKIKPRGAWVAARLGTHGTWELFKNPQAGQTARFRDRFIRPFYNNYLRQMTPDGVSTVSPGYAFARLGSNDGRPQKTGFADVLEFTGVDNRYYDHPKLENFYRWLFGYSVTPAKEYHLFGDVGPQWGFGNSALFWRVGRFDQRAAAYAAWLLEGKNPPGHILSYILMQNPLPDPVVPQSRLFMEGEAVFREPQDSPMSLGAALYSISENAEYHTHEEANAISIAGYGNNLVVNGGWLGRPTWPASMNNTLTIDGESHNEKIGGGLVEGLTSHGFDYAVGDSGKALGDDAFYRSLILIHGSDGLPEDLLTGDEVDADPTETVHHHLQLASTDPAEVVTEKRHFRAVINHHAEVEGVSMDVFFAGDPASVEQELIPSGFLERTPSSGKHYRLTSVFPTDETGDARLLAVMFPANESHAAADLSRIAGEGYRGVAVEFRDGVQDFAIESAGDAAIEHEGAALRARLAVFRTRGEDTDFYFTRLGTSFRRGKVGFTSDAPISIHMAGSRGAVTSNGATVTLRHPGVTGIRMNGEAVEPTEARDGQLRVHLPEGRHDIELRTE